MTVAADALDAPGGSVAFSPWTAFLCDQPHNRIPRCGGCLDPVVLLPNPPPLGQMPRIVICRPDLVRFLMRKLLLDRIRMRALLVEQRRCHAPKPMSGHLSVRIPESTERSVDRVVTHRSVAVSLARKHEPPVASQWLKLSKDFDSLGGERDVIDRITASNSSGLISRIESFLSQGKMLLSRRRMILSPCPGAHVGECLASHSRAIASKVFDYPAPAGVAPLLLRSSAGSMPAASFRRTSSNRSRAALRLTSGGKTLLLALESLFEAPPAPARRRDL